MPFPNISFPQFDFASFHCPSGFVFEGSRNSSHFALCYKGQIRHEFDVTARCEREWGQERNSFKDLHYRVEFGMKKEPQKL